MRPGGGGAGERWPGIGRRWYASRRWRSWRALPGHGRRWQSSWRRRRRRALAGYGRRRQSPWRRRQWRALAGYGRRRHSPWRRRRWRALAGYRRWRQSPWRGGAANAGPVSRVESTRIGNRPAMAAVTHGSGIGSGNAIGSGNIGSGNIGHVGDNLGIVNRPQIRREQLRREFVPGRQYLQRQQPQLLLRLQQRPRDRRQRGGGWGGGGWGGRRLRRRYGGWLVAGRLWRRLVRALLRQLVSRQLGQRRLVLAGFGVGALTSFGLGSLYGGGWATARGLGLRRLWLRHGLYNYFPTWGMSTYSGWGLGSVASNWLYSGYTNPYYATVVGCPAGGDNRGLRLLAADQRGRHAARRRGRRQHRAGLLRRARLLQGRRLPARHSTWPTRS